MLKICLTVLLLLGFVHANAANAATCIFRKYRIEIFFGQLNVIDIYNRPDGSGVYSPQWEGFITYSSDGALIDEIVAWEGVRDSLEFLGFYEYNCSQLPPDDPPDDPPDCSNGNDCCGLVCLRCLGFDFEKYGFLIPFFPPCDEDEDEDEDDYKYLIWIDYVSQNLSVLFGLWGSRPQGCSAFGAKLDKQNNSIVEEYYGDFSQYADFGSHLVKSKNGVSSDHDFSNFPIRHDEEGYLENYFLASWINPQCIFSPGGASRHSIGNSFDWLWDILSF